MYVWEPVVFSAGRCAGVGAHIARGPRALRAGRSRRVPRGWCRTGLMTGHGPCWYFFGSGFAPDHAAVTDPHAGIRRGGWLSLLEERSDAYPRRNAKFTHPARGIARPDGHRVRGGRVRGGRVRGGWVRRGFAVAGFAVAGFAVAELVARLALDSVGLVGVDAAGVMTVARHRAGCHRPARAPEILLSGVLAFGAVAFMYLATEELLVEAHEKAKPRSAVSRSSSDS